ncbi:MAG: hypothetical protein VCD33_10600 [Alphaproteobacteria bacterium]|jgi:hypothetical protein
MFGETKIRSMIGTTIVPAFLFGIWGFGIGAMMLGSAYASQCTAQDADGSDYRQQPTCITYAYQDASGEYTVYLRGTKRTAYADLDYLED